MTHTLEQIAAIADGLGEQGRSIASSLLGNSWVGVGKPSPGLQTLLDKAFMAKFELGHRFKVYPTPLGLAVRNHLEQTNDEQ